MRAIARAQQELELSLDALSYPSASPGARLQFTGSGTDSPAHLQATRCLGWRALGTGWRTTCTC